MAFKNKLSIYMIKDEFAEDDREILKPSSELLQTIENIGNVYYCPSQNTTPEWVNSFFCGCLEDKNLFTSNARVVLISRIELENHVTKAFAVVMGYGKFMLQDDVTEDDFGLKVVLNTISPDSLRRINKTNIGGNQKTSNEQLPLESDIAEFGFDIDRDLISHITGESNDEDLATGIITGGELLSLTADVDIYSLKPFLKIAYNRYQATEYKATFPWIDNIKKVKDSRIIKELDAKLIDLINAGDKSVWMAVPDVIDWEEVGGFKYAGREVYQDIDISIVKESFKNGLTVIDQLKNKHISALDAADDAIYASWNAYKCIFGELELKGKVYCINNGRWFCIDRNFVDIVNREYEEIPISTRSFIDCDPSFTKESQYTKSYVATDPDHLLCMDAKVIHYGGGRSSIELCDIRTSDGEYIHIKPYSGSATLSHLFNQAVVSAELVVGDGLFRKDANKKIKELSKNPVFRISNTSNLKVILAIISKYDVSRPKIPFFSKVALRYAKKRLELIGCSVAIKNIVKK